MKNRLIRLALLLVCTVGLQAQSLVFPPDLSQQLKRDVDYLASDLLKGRDTPSPELDTAAAYIHRSMAQMGLSFAPETTGDPGFNLIRTRLGKGNALRVTLNGQTHDLKIKDDFVPHPNSGDGNVTAPVVFVGYGITAPEYGYDDYAGLDVRGAIVWVLTLEPQAEDSASVFKGVAKTAHAKVETKLANAWEHGAAGVVLMTGPLHHNLRRPPNAWPSLMRNPNMNALMLRTEQDLEHALPLVQIGRQGAETLLQGLGSPVDVKAIQEAIDSTLQPHSFFLDGLEVTIQTDFIHQRTRVCNVVGLLEGSNPELKNQTIVIGGHYDHLGMQGDSLVFNGADDNASGVAGVLALAKIFSMPENRPQRSLLFCAWAGEEKGLLGATHFVEQTPLWPLADIDAYINLDMIGRLDSARVWVSGTETSPEWEAWVTEALSEEDLVFINEEKVSRSDHVPFYRQRIPVLDASTGFHPDYHQVSDTADKIDFSGMTRVVRAFGTVIQRLANAAERPVFQEDPDSPLAEKPDME